MIGTRHFSASSAKCETASHRGRLSDTLSASTVREDVRVTVWGFLAVVVVSLVGAFALLRRRPQANLDEARRQAMAQARDDAAAASVERQRTAAEIARQGEAKAQAERIASQAQAQASVLAGDTSAQATAVSDLIGAAPPKPVAGPRGPE